MSQLARTTTRFLANTASIALAKPVKLSTQAYSPRLPFPHDWQNFIGNPTVSAIICFLVACTPATSLIPLLWISADIQSLAAVDSCTF
jgi:hypothetical protein